MKKEKKIVILVVLIAFALLVNVSASGFSPTSLIFNLSVNEKQCQKITITSDSDTITLADKWAENENVVWQTTRFNKTAAYHHLTLTYPSKLEKSQREVEVCLSGRSGGEFHGVILLKEEQVGNSIIQMGVWVKAVISGAELPKDESSENRLSSVKTETSSEVEEAQTIENIQEENSENAGITGAVVGDGRSGLMLVSVSFIIGVVVLYLIVLGAKRWKKRNIYGY